MKNKFLSVILAMAFFMANLFGCGTASSDAAEVTASGETFGITASQENTSGNQADDTQKTEDNRSEATDDGEGGSTTEYPTTDDILATIDAGESKVYWIADAYEATGTLDVINVDIFEPNALWEKVSDLLGTGYSAQDITTVGFSIVSENLRTDEVINTLTETTGMEYTEISAGDEFATKYVPMVNGYSVDEEGYSSGSNGDYIAGSYIGFNGNGVAFVCMPLHMGSVQETVNASELISMQNVEALCTAYYENYGIPSVVVIESVELVYYYSSTNQQLRPAWVCQTTAYMSKNGHGDSVLIDAITGELLRK